MQNMEAQQRLEATRAAFLYAESKRLSQKETEHLYQAILSAWTAKNSTALEEVAATETAFKKVVYFI